MERTHQIQQLYNMVCNAPRGASIQLLDMPRHFLNDKMDNTVPHVHTFYEIIWFQTDGGFHTVDFRRYNIVRNTLLFISPGQVHFFDNPMQSRGVIIRFCTDTMSGADRTEDIFIKYNMFNTFDGEPLYTVSDATAEALDGIVGRMREETGHSDAFGHQDILMAYLKIFIITVNRHSTQAMAHRLDEWRPSHRLFVMFRKMVEERMTSMHTVKEYAGKLNVSTKTLSNSVIECTGKTPLAFINGRMALEAKRLLRYSNMTGKEVAYHLGFDDPSYFVKFFKRETGFLPSEFKTD